MKRRNEILALALILIAFICIGAAKDVLYGIISYDKDTGIATVHKQMNFTEPASIGTASASTDELTVYSKYALDVNGETVEIMRITVQMTDNTHDSVDSIVKIYKIVNGILTQAFP